jgi:hypothetical protein
VIVLKYVCFFSQREYSMAGSLYEVLVDKMGMREVIKNRKIGNLLTQQDYGGDNQDGGQLFQLLGSNIKKFNIRHLEF